MAKFPDKCSRCGAPISWEEGASTVKCDFCGNINYSKNDYLNSKITRDIIKKLDQIYVPAKLVLRNKYSKVLLLSSIIFIFGSIINKSINDPVKPYKAKIDEVCTKVAFMEKTDTAQNKNLVDCKKYMRNSIISLDKIFSKALERSKTRKLVRELSDRTRIIDPYSHYKRTKALTSWFISWSIEDHISIQYNYMLPQKAFVSQRGILDYKIPQKYRLKRIKKDCKKIKPLQIAIYNWITEKNKAIKIEEEKISSMKLNNTEINGYKSEFMFQKTYEYDLEKINYKNWYSKLNQKKFLPNVHYNTPNEIHKVKKLIRNNDLLSVLKFTKPINKSNFINQNQCIKNLTNQIINTK